MEYESYNDEEQDISENINRIKNLNLDLVDKMALILILAGAKPGTEITVFDRHTNPEDIISVLEDCGLISIPLKYQFMLDAKNRGIGGTEGYKCHIIVAKDEAITKEIMKYGEAQDDKEYGKLMGFPQTAIDAYVSDAERAYLHKNVALLSFEEQETILEELKLKSIIRFRLSRAHWREEVKVLQEWERIVKMYAPELLEDKHK